MFPEKMLQPGRAEIYEASQRGHIDRRILLDCFEYLT
jgi:hypothetical protein